GNDIIDLNTVFRLAGLVAGRKLSPEYPTARQMSPLANASANSGDWNFFTSRLMPFKRSAACFRSAWRIEAGSSFKNCSAIANKSSGLSRTSTPQLENFFRFSGLNTMFQESSKGAWSGAAEAASEASAGAPPVSSLAFSMLYARPAVNHI